MFTVLMNGFGCGRFGFGRFGLWLFWIVAVLDCGRFGRNSNILLVTTITITNRYEC